MRLHADLLGLQFSGVSSPLCSFNSSLCFKVGCLSFSGNALFFAPNLLKLELQLLIVTS